MSYNKKTSWQQSSSLVNKSDGEKNDPFVPVSLNEDMFRQLFGEGINVDDVIQISFDDVESDANKSENVITVRPKEFVKTGDKISTHIVEDFRKGQAEYRIGRKTSYGIEPIVTRVSFAYQNFDMFEDKDFSSMDKEVHDSVVSLYAAGNKVFSPAMVYRTMTGKNDSTFVPQEKIREISKSIHKCMASIITIDSSEEASIYGLEARYSQNLIYAKSVTLKTRGWEVSAFLLMDEPVLFKYAKMRRQLFSVPLRVLDTPPNKTNDIIVLQGYLIRVVEGLRRPSEEETHEIFYSSLYNLLNCQNASKQKLQRIRDSVKSILDYWVRIGYIDDYSETLNGRSKHSIFLEVSPTLLSS